MGPPGSPDIGLSIQAAFISLIPVPLPRPLLESPACFMTTFCRAALSLICLLSVGVCTVRECPVVLFLSPPPPFCFVSYLAVVALCCDVSFDNDKLPVLMFQCWPVTNYPQRTKASKVKTEWWCVTQPILEYDSFLILVITLMPVSILWYKKPFSLPFSWVLSRHCRESVIKLPWIASLFVCYCQSRLIPIVSPRYCIFAPLYPRQITTATEDVDPP